MQFKNIAQIPEELTSHPPVMKKVMIKKGEVPHLLQFAQVTLKKGESSGMHHHESMTEIFFIESGEGVIVQNDEIHNITKGICIITESGEMHDVQNTGDKDLVITYFNLSV